MYNSTNIYFNRLLKLILLKKSGSSSQQFSRKISTIKIIFYKTVCAILAFEFCSLIP